MNRSACIALLGFLLCAPLAHAALRPVHLTPLTDTSSWQQGKWGRFGKFAGTYDYDSVLNDPEVNTALQALVGGAFDHLVQDLSVHGPIGTAGDCLTFAGNAPHQGGAENAMLLVCMRKGELHAAIYSGKAIHLYSHADAYEHLNPTLTQWIEHQNDSGQPTNLIWHKEQL